MSIQDILNKNRYKIEEMLKNGDSYNSIARWLNINSGNVYIYCKKNNITNNSERSSNHGKLIFHKEEIISLIKDGTSISKVAKKLGFKTSSVAKFIKLYLPEFNFETSYDPNNLLINKKDDVIKLNKEGFNANQISKKLGFSQSSVRALFIKLGLDTSLEKYGVDESFFEKINTQEKAYCLGFWYSDGNVSSNFVARIGLAEQDVEILEKIKNCLKFEGPLYYKDIKIPNRQNMVELHISRKKICDDLINLGCVRRKSLILKFPSLTIVPMSLISHFIRGYFDGDGSIYKNSVSFTGSYDFIYELKNYLPCNITNIYQRYKQKDRKLSAHTLAISRLKETIKCLDWLYEDATIFLKRKHDRYLQLKQAGRPVCFSNSL